MTARGGGRTIRSMPASKKPTIRRLFVFLCGLLVFVLARPTPVLFAVGAAVAFLGEALRIWACGHLRKNQAVIQSGPYAHVKNPLYLGTFLILLGIVVASTDARVAPSRYLLLLLLPFCLGVFFVYYLPRKFAVEANRLRRRFGEVWDAYDRAVPSFVPSLVPRVRSEHRWDSRLVTENSEVSCAAFVVLGLALVGVRFFVELPLFGG